MKEFIIKRRSQKIDEENDRRNVVQIARLWRGTPYQPRQSARGRGCDCGTLVLGIYHEAGLVEMPQDGWDYDWLAPWAQRGGDRHYLDAIESVSQEIEEKDVQAGDLVIYRIGRGWSHAALVLEWPRSVLHATRHAGVIETTGAFGILSGRPRRFFSYWRFEECFAGTQPSPLTC